MALTSAPRSISSRAASMRLAWVAASSALRPRASRVSTGVPASSSRRSAARSPASAAADQGSATGTTLRRPGVGERHAVDHALDAGAAGRGLAQRTRPRGGNEHAAGQRIAAEPAHGVAQRLAFGVRIGIVGGEHAARARRRRSRRRAAPPRRRAGRRRARLRRAAPRHGAWPAAARWRPRPGRPARAARPARSCGGAGLHEWVASACFNCAGRTGQGKCVRPTIPTNRKTRMKLQRQSLPSSPAPPAASARTSP